MKQTNSPYRYLNGLRDGVPIGLGYLSVSFGFGITAVGQGLHILEALLISMTNLTSAGQVAGVTVMVAGGTVAMIVAEMILTQLIINLRYSLMGITLTQRLDSNCTTRHRLLMSFGMTDEIFALAASKPYPVGPSYFYGLMTAPYIGWAGGTLLGALAGQILPMSVRLALGIAIYAMFVAIVLPPMRRERGVLMVVAIAAGLSCLIRYLPFLQFISDGFSIIVCAIIASLVMAWLKPIEEKEGIGDDT
ncbi:MAG: AzlC family ABC transporter permease [Clostridia bacterium]|nr:AzlC family ABC transporter permease [Clostridia bacterium]